MSDVTPFAAGSADCAIVSPRPAQLAEALFAAALDCIVVADSSGRIVEFNPAAERVFGWTRDEIIGLTMDDTFIPHVHRRAHRVGMARYLAGQQARVIGKRLSLTALHRDGQLFPIELTISETQVDDRTFFVAHIRDMAAETEARRAAEESRAMLQSFIDNAPVPMTHVGLDGGLLLVNKVCAALYELTPAELLTLGLAGVAAPWLDYEETIRPAVHQVIATGESRLVTAMFDAGPQRGRLTIAVSVFPLFGPDGEVSSVGTVGFDLTEQAQARADMEEAKALVEAFIRNAPNPMALMDAHGRYVMINKAAARYYEQTPEALLAAGPAAINAPFSEARTVITPMLRRVLETGEMEQIFTPFVTPGGDTRDMAFSFFPILGAAGELAFIGNISFDLTEERSAKAALQTLQSQLLALFNHAPVDMYLKDEAGRVIFCSPGMARSVGRSQAEMVGLSEEQFIHPALLDGLRQVDARIVETRQPETREALDPRTGRYQIVTRFPILDPAGQVVQIGGMIVDIDDRVRAEEALARSKEALHQSEKLAALGQLLAGVAHELNNPLSVVRGRSELLEEQLAGTGYAASLRKLTEAADRCARIVKAFLAMARQTGPQRVMSHVNDLVDIAIDLTCHGLRNAGIAVTTILADDMPDIAIDDDQIVQVLVNLIINAQHALETAREPRTLVIRTQFDAAGPSVIIEVADNGPGITAAVASRVFDPFFTTKPVGQGTGLGLSVCKGIVEGHDGSFRLSETPGGGATFRVVLPARSVDAAQAAAVAVAGPRALRGHVLIVDDEAEVAGLLADCLGSVGFRCTVADGGEAALKLIEQDRFDVVFSDVRMPGMDGLTLFDRMAEAQPALADRFIFVSGDVLHGDFKAVAAKGRPVIEKPFNAGAVRDAALAIAMEKGAR